MSRQASTTIEKECYVCGEKIKKDPVYILQGNYRHGACEPGSVKWLKSKHSQKSEYSDILRPKEKTETILATLLPTAQPKPAKKEKKSSWKKAKKK